MGTVPLRMRFRTFTRALLALCTAGFLATGAACSSGGASSASGSTPVDHLTVSTSAADFTFASLYLAQSEGLFAKHGLQVTILTGPAASAIPYLVAGKADLTLYSILPGLLAADQGADITYIYQNIDVFGVALIGSKDITTIAQAQHLNSCRLATTPAGSLTYNFAHLYSQELHLKCTLVQLANNALIASGVEAGSYQLGVNSLAPAVAAQAAGAHILIDPRSATYQQYYAPPPYMVEAYYGIGTRLEKMKGAVVKFLQAIQDAENLFRTQTPAQLTAEIRTNSAFAGQSTSSLVTGFTQLQSQMQGGCNGQPHGDIDQACWAATLSGVATWGVPTFNPSSAANTYASRVDMSYYDAARPH